MFLINRLGRSFCPVSKNKKSVAEDLRDNSLITDIRGAPDLQAILEFINLWIIIENQPQLSFCEEISSSGDLLRHLG
jgi:hypothetical protein